MPCDWFDASERAFLDPAKYPNGPIQGAIDAASFNGGGTVYIPAATWEISSTVVVNHAPHQFYNPLKPLIIQGSGTNSTILQRKATAGAFDLLALQRSFVIVRDLALDGNNPTVAMKGVVVGVPSPPPPIPMGEPPSYWDVRHVSLRDVIVRNVKGYALHVLGGYVYANPAPPPTNISPPIAIVCSFVDCVFAANGTGAAGVIRLEPRNTTIDFLRCAVESFYGRAVDLFGCSGVTFDRLRVSSAQPTNANPYLVANEAINCQVLNSWFEEPSDATSTQWFVYLDRLCHGWTIGSTMFIRRVGTLPRAIVVGNSGSGQECRGVVIVNPFVLTTAGLPTAQHVQAINPLSEVQLIGGIAAGGTNPALSFAEIQVYFDNGAPGPSRTMISNNRRFRAASVDGVLPTGNLRAGDVIVDGGILKMWNGTAWKAILTA